MRSLNLWAAFIALNLQALPLRAETKAADPVTRAIEIDLRKRAVRVDGVDKKITFGRDYAYTDFDVEPWLGEMPPNFVKRPHELTIETAPDAQIIASGELIESRRLENGRALNRFREDKPYSAYLYGFAVGHFRHVNLTLGGVTIDTYGVRLTPVKLRKLNAYTFEILRYYQSLLGLRLPHKRYAQVFLPEPVAQEKNGFALLAEDDAREFFKNPREDWFIAHELAHEWFGNLTSGHTWRDIWLGEGFAVYFTALWKAHKWGEREFRRELSLARARYESARAAGRDRPIVSDDWDHGVVNRPITYAKAALVVHRLRRLLGDERFFRAASAFVNDFQYQAPRTEDFQKAFETAACDQGGERLRSAVTRSFQEYVYQPGHLPAQD